MADFGMTPNGFVPKRQADIIDDLNTGLAAIVDPATGEKPFLNASDDSILQQILGVFSGGLSECWDAAYEASVQFDPLKNTGAGQSATVQLNGILRKPGTYTRIILRLTGRQGATVPQGSRVTTLDGLHTFTTDIDAVIPSAGHIDVQTTATEKGDFVPDLGAVARIDTPVSGWLTASNTSLLAQGSNEETDEELRIRQQRSTAQTSYRIIDAIYAAVMNVPGVIYARAYQNSKENPEDDRGIPFKEVAVIAEGGDQREIAEALYLRFPTGQIGYGDVHEVFYDKYGIADTISFSRPVDVPVYVSMQLVVTNRDEFPDNYADLIRNNIINYAQYSGQLTGAAGFPPGEDIIRTRLYTPVNLVPGHSIQALTIGLSADTLSNNDIDIQWNEVGRFTSDRIVVSVVGL